MKFLLLVIAAVALIGFGGYRMMFGDAGVTPEARMACEASIRAEHAGDAESIRLLTEKCSDPGMVAMTAARASGASAQETAQLIANANQGDVTSHLLNMGAVGLGIGLLFAAVVGMRRRAV